MATIKTMTYRLWRRLEGGNITDDSKYTYRELRGYITSGIAKALHDSYFEQRNLEEFKYGDDSITTKYKATVLTDAETGLKYVPLQNKTISIAGNRFTMVSSLNPINRFAINYIPIRQEELIVRKLQATIPNVVLFYKEDGKLFFYSETTPDTQVYVKDRYAIPSDDDAEITLPAEFENAVHREALGLMLGPQAVEDRANDGVPVKP